MNNFLPLLNISCYVGYSLPPIFLQFVIILANIYQNENKTSLIRLEIKI